MADEGGLEAVGRFQRLVPLDQRALGVLRVGDIDIGEQRAAVGQRQRGAGEHAAVGPVELALIGTPLGDDGRHRRLDALPFLGRVVEHAAPGDDLVDMRLAVELARVQPPDRGEGAVVEPQAAVRREHRDAFAQRVERFALHLDQRVVAAFERDPLGDVLVEIGHARLALAVGDDMQRAAVGQVP